MASRGTVITNGAARRPQGSALAAGPGDARTDRRRQWIAGALLVLAVGLAYWPVTRAGFIWDDDDYIINNPTLLDASGLARIWASPGATPQYYPLVFTTFWCEHALWGLSPLGYHLVNVALHAGASLVLWRLLRRLSVPGAMLGALLFALHPVHVESVAWVTERKNVLSGLLYLLSAWAYLRFDPPAGDAKRRWRWYAASMALFVAALLSKTVTCSLPVAIGLVLWWKRPKLTLGALWPLAPMLAIGACFAGLTVWMEKQHVGAQGLDWQLSAAQRVLIAGRALWFYAAKLAWPAKLTFIYPRWSIDPAKWMQWLYPASAAALVATLWLTRRRVGKGPLVAVMFFGVSLVPALGFINVYPMRYSYVADHFQYLASIGLLALGAAAIGPILRRLLRASAVALAVLLLAWPIALGVLTARQARIYRDLGTLWTDTLAKNPGSAMAHVSLGVYYYSQGQLERAMEQYRASLAIRDDMDETHASVAAVLDDWGRHGEALTHRQRAVELRCDKGVYHAFLAGTLTRLGRLDEALAAAQQAVQMSPQLPVGYENLAVVLMRQAKPDQAETALREGIARGAESPGVRLALAQTLVQQDRRADALRELEASLRLTPNHAPTLHAAGVLWLEAGQPGPAIEAFSREIEAVGDQPEALRQLGNALATAGQWAQAAEAYERALPALGNDPDLHNNLAVALEHLNQPERAAEHYRKSRH